MAIPSTRTLALRQLELDSGRTARFPGLMARKWARMSASPLAFLRGAAPLFYELLAAEAAFAEGPAGAGIIQGDAHLENFGAFSPVIEKDGEWEKGHATFQLNDFDEATQGAWRWDVLRLTTSLVLAGRELGQNGPAVLALCDRLLGGYVATAFEEHTLPRVPAVVVAFVNRVDGRSHKKLFDERTETVGGTRRFVRGDRYLDLPAALEDLVPQALRRFAERTASHGGPSPEQVEVIDAALRIAGTGSLGALRVAALTRGKGGEEGSWLFDMKEQIGSSVDVLAPRVASESRAAEVENAVRTCLELPPRMLGTSRLAGHDVLVRRLTPQEDKLSLGRLAPEDLPELAAYLGALLGVVHRRGSQEKFAPWTGRECGGILERAVSLAGIHEAVYLELCLLQREEHRADSKPLQYCSPVA